MNAKTVLLCVCFLLFCLVAKAEEIGSNAVASDISSTSNKIETQENVPQQEFFFKEGKGEVFWDGSGSEKTIMKIGPKSSPFFSMVVHIGNEEVSFKVGGAEGYCNLTGLRKAGYYKLTGLCEGEDFPQDPTKCYYIKLPRNSCAGVWEGDSIVLKLSKNRYVAIKPTKFVHRYKSVEETPQEYRKTYKEVTVKVGGELRTSMVQTDQDAPAPLKSVKYKWRYWPNVVPESERAAQEAGIRTLAVPPAKNFYCNGISFSWETSPMTLNYEVKLSSIEKLEFALAKGAKLADIKDPAKFDFNQVNYWQGSYGKIAVDLNDVIIFRLNNDKCFAFVPLKVEDNGVVKTSSGEVKNKSVVYQQRDWSKPKPIKPSPELVKTAQNK